MSTCDDVGDICNLGSLTCTVAFPENSIQNNNLWRKNSNNGDDDDEDDMCLIDDENFLTYDGETGPTLEKNTDAKKVSLCVSPFSLIFQILF